MVYRQTPRSERLRAARRARMLKAARKLFSRRGYEVTTMRDVAAAAGTSIGNLYFYFKDKEALLETLLAGTRALTWAGADEAAATVPPGPARLAILMYSNALALLGPDRDLTSMLLLRGAPPDVTERGMEEYRVRLRAYFREYVPRMGDGERELAITAWTGAARNLLERHLREDLDIAPKLLAEFAVRWNLRGAGFSESDIDLAVQTAAGILGPGFDSSARSRGRSPKPNLGS
jgi:AcrR family transcriptional regulator